MSVDKNILNLIMQRKKKRAQKVEQVRQYREEILTLRYEHRLALSDICAYLESKYGISVSPETLKKAVPEVVNRLERVIKLLPSLSHEELFKLYEAVKEELNRRKPLEENR